MILYRLLISVFVLAQSLRLLARGDLATLRARFGKGVPTGSHPTLWIHAASNGELASARPVIAALAENRPDLRLWITCNTASGVELAESWGQTASLAPFDLARVSARVLRAANVTAHLTMESEIWPHRVRLCPGPVLVLGARMSPGSARGWRRFGTAGRDVLQRLAYVSAQDAGSRDRLRDLGVPPAALGPVVDLKALYQPPAGQQPDAALQTAYPRAQTWLAASTHAGEEEAVIAAHLEARRQRPGLRLILAPRHPRRADEIARLLDNAGLPCDRRSEGKAGAEVLLADTLGEMPLWYRLAGTVFIGGTLTDRGGHTPYEPAAFGAALIHGPDVANFTQSFARLANADAARRISDATALARALIDLSDPETQERRGLAAAKALRQDTDLSGLMADVLAHLGPPGPRQS